MTGVWTAKEVALQCGVVLPQVHIVYQTYGELAPRRDNVVLYPTSYGAHHTDIDWLIAPDGILDPTRWFIVIPNMLGNGLSSSPSNGGLPGLAEQGCYVTHWDNVTLQARLLWETWGIERLALVYGWSMGAQQAYHWGALYPERVERLVALCGTARTTPHNRVFLLSLRAALTADPVWDGQTFRGTPERGYRAFARIYASWAVSQAFYRAKMYQTLGYRDVEDYLVRGWEANYRRRDPRDLLAMLDTWLRCDVGDNPLYQGDYEKALRSIRAATLVMTCTTDLYFPPADCAAEAAIIPQATFRLIPSIWGHRAGNPWQYPPDAAFIRRAVQEWLAA